MKAYSTRATARRAAIADLSKGMNMSKEDVSKAFDTMATIEETAEGFFWRRIQIARPSYAAADDADYVAGNSKKEVVFAETGEFAAYADEQVEVAAAAAGVTPDEAAALTDYADAEEAVSDYADDEEPVTDYAAGSEDDKTLANRKFKGKGEPAIPVVHSSNVDSPCKRVWEMAASMPDSSRKDVIAACVEQGIATATARTQYQRWYRAGKPDTYPGKK